MSKQNQLGTVSHWMARVLGLLFLALVTVGWWDESQARQDLPGGESGDWIFAWAIYTHLLPLALIAVGYTLAWAKPIWGAIAFGIYSVLQAISVGTEFIYIPLVVLPPLVIAILFLIPWLQLKRHRSS